MAIMREHTNIEYKFVCEGQSNTQGMCVCVWGGGG